MSKGDKIRKSIFKEFSQNFSRVMDNPHLKRINIDFYICPLCFESFTKQHLNQSTQNPLTIEDIPPKRLNGKPLLLTCKKCNNVNGSVYDSELGKWFKAYCALEGKGELDLKMAIGSSRTFKAKLARDIENEMTSINSHKPNPYAEENVSKMHNEGKAEVKFLLDFGDDKKIDDGFLRFAYLYAFYYFGYAYIFSPGGTYVKDYFVLNKNQELKPLVISDKLEELDQSIYKISHPTDITSFLVVFKLGSEITKNIGVILPGPKKEHVENFRLINKEKIGPLKFQQIIKQDINHRPFSCYQIWK